MSKRNGSMKHSPFDYLIQYGYSSMLPYSISRPQWVKTTHVDIIHLQTEADMKGQNRHILEFINNIQNIFMYHLNMNGSFQGLFCLGPLWTKQQDNFTKSHNILKLWDICSDLPDHYETWQISQEQCCQGICQISEWYDYFDTDLMTLRLCRILWLGV